ncbi:MAG: DinB family protein [Ignavibacteriales bacterium]|nr:DinB family protein [Ignavibacteriales bacterium]
MKVNNMRIQFRPGAIGALMDEYERVALELKNLLSTISQEEFIKIFDPYTRDEDCRSIQSVMKHVVSAGYRYADQICDFLKVPVVNHNYHIYNVVHAIDELENFIFFTAGIVKENLRMTDEEISATKKETRWGLYDIEMMFEHAIVHILRHRRQIEKFMASHK